MRFRAIHLRAILLPLGVAMASIGAVAWYGLVKIPAQQRYMTERNLRLLKTKSAQIKSRVDSFDSSIDHALEFFPGKSDDADYLEQLQNYVRRFAPGLEVVTALTLEAEKTLAGRVGDPPRVIVQRVEGKYFLFLGYGHGNAKIVAKTDLEQTLAPFLTTGTEFDALLLVSRDGRVLLQRSSSGLELAHVNSLRDSSRPSPTPPAAAAGQRAEPANLFETLRTSTSIANVVLGNAEYQMYVQPVQLSLNAGEGKGWPASSLDDTPQGGDVPEEWALCGFVRADHFRAASSSISYTYLLWFGVALVTVCLATPLLKLHMLSPSERLQGSDAVLVAATTFLFTALITFCAIDAYYLHAVNVTVDDNLRDAAESIRKNFADETAAIAAQMKKFEGEKVWLDGLGYKDVLKGAKNKSVNLSSYRASLTAVDPSDTPPTIIRREKRSFKCVDPLACRDHVLANGLAHFTYPYFDLIVFDDQAGWQRIKWSTRGVTPFINIRDARLPYFAQLRSARLLIEAGEPTATGGVSVTQSPNTGEIQTVFWKAFDRKPVPAEPTGVRNAPQRAKGTAARDADLIGVTMSTGMISMVNPVLPAHLQFAVVDNTGRVMFHSDTTRRLQENFFLECEDNPALAAAASGRRSMSLSVYYLGRSYRMFAAPLDLDLQSFANPGWTLIVFEDNVVAETLNLETLTAAGGLFALYASALAVAWILLHWLGRGRLSKWFWPSESAGASYLYVMLVNGALTVVFLGWIAHFESSPLLVGTVLLALGGIVSTFFLVTRPHATRTATPWWPTMFHGARVSFLLIVAAVPAIACFQVAYHFESTLLTLSNQATVAGKLGARDLRIKANADRRTLCKTETSAEDCDVAVATFIRSRTWPESGIRWDVNASDVVWKKDGPVPLNAAMVTRLDVVLGWMHGTYNDVAGDLTAVLPDGAGRAAVERRWRHLLEAGDGTNGRLARTPAAASTATLTSSVAPAAPTAGLWLIVAGLAGVLYTLVSVVVGPLYAFTLCRRRGVEAASIDLDASSHLLLIGPPGAGKTRRLASEANIRVFDTRTQSFFEERAAARPVSIERRGDSYATGGGGSVLAWSGPPEPPTRTAADTAKRIDWLDPPDLPADTTVLIGIDHLESCLDNREERGRVLRFLEEVTYRHKRTVWIASAREPIGQLQESSDACPDAAELARWIRVLQPFHEARVGLADGEPSIAGDDPEETATVAAPYYRAVWASCSKAEQLALRQLAEEGVVNPNNDPVVSQLMRSGLVRRTPTFSVMSERFRLFVLHALSPGEISEREHADVTLPWASITTAMLTVALGLGALLVLTSQQLVDASIGYVPALAPAVPTVMKLLTSARRDGKPGALTA